MSLPESAGWQLMSKYVIALYIRLSIEDTKCDSLSIENQKITLHQFVDSHAEENTEILEFIDNGYTGVNFERPAMQELLDMVREHKIDCIIVKDFSRFGRSSIETGYFIEQVFPLYRTRFISVNDDFDSNNYIESTGGMEVAFKYLINEYYSLDLSKKSKSAKYAKMQDGTYKSKVCCYGYKTNADKNLEIDEETAPIVKFIFYSAFEGKTAHEIVQNLYDMKIPTPAEYKDINGHHNHDVSKTHGIWQRSTVLRILENEQYTGTYIMGKYTVKEVGGHRTRRKDEFEWFKIPDHHPAIVDKSIFQQVQSKIRHFKSEKKINHDYALRSKVICGCCGHVMYRLRKKEPLFICNHSRVDKNYSCHGLQIKESELENIIFDIISKQAEIILNVDSISESNDIKVCSEQQSEYKKLIENYQDEKMQLYEQFILGEIDETRYKTMKEKIDDEVNSLNQIYSAISSKSSQIQADNKIKAELQNTAKVISSETVLNKVLVDMLIEKIQVYPDYMVEIDWKINEFYNETV